MTIDELRVQRSIASIMSKIEASILAHEPQRYRDWLESEREFERQCMVDNIIYSPSKYISLCK